MHNSRIEIKELSSSLELNAFQSCKGQSEFEFKGWMIDGNGGFWINGGLPGSGSGATLYSRSNGISWVFLMNGSNKPGGRILCKYHLDLS